MSDLIEPVDAYRLLRAAIAHAGSQASYARKVGISPQFLSDVLHGTRDIPVAVLTDLGLVRVTRYRRRKQGDTANAG